MFLTKKIKLMLLLVLCFSAPGVRADVHLTGDFISYPNAYCPQAGQPNAEEVRRCRGFIRDQSGNLLATPSPNTFLHYSTYFVAPSPVYQYFANASCSRNSPELAIVPRNVNPTFIDGADNVFYFDVQYACPQ